ncbi:Senescence marker protein-30 [Pseudomonas syringae pv. pisi]|nr:Senescence marker protein-30 [Pseudomonas syringae pv. pisi]
MTHLSRSAGFFAMQPDAEQWSGAGRGWTRQRHKYPKVPLQQ